MIKPKWTLKKKSIQLDKVDKLIVYNRDKLNNLKRDPYWKKKSLGQINNQKAEDEVESYWNEAGENDHDRMSGIVSPYYFKAM